MSAVAREVGMERPRKVNWVAWGNWYILRAAIEEGWPSIYACLQQYGEFQAAHRVLCRDMPPEIRRVDIAVASLPALLQNAIVLWYQCDRDVRGKVIPAYTKAFALDMPASTYEESVRVGKFMAEREMSTVRYVELELAK